MAVAIALRRRGLTVAVLERSAAPRTRIGETVPGELHSTLQALGVWPKFCAQAHLRSAGSASAWATGELARSDAFCSALGGGWHLDRRRFEELLLDETTAAGAALHSPTKVVGIQTTPGQAHRLHAIDPAGRRLALEARVLIDATGRAATVARWLGARRVIHDRLVCAYTTFPGATRAAGERRTLVEAVEDGWWYATPLPGGRALVGLFCDPRTVRARGYARAAPWQTALARTAHVHDYLGKPSRPRAPRLAAVTPHCLDRPAGRDWIALGDAAASFDPLSSAGIALALRDGLEAADAVTRRLNGDIGALVRHSSVIQLRFARYLAQRAEVYGLARRWPASPFWRERSDDKTAIAMDL